MTPACRQLRGSALEEKLLKRVRAFAHVDDPLRAAAYARTAGRRCATYAELSPAEQRLARMLFFSLWSDGGGFSTRRRRPRRPPHGDARPAQKSAPSSTSSFEAARHVALALSGDRSRTSRCSVHARYQREEILAALDFPRHAQQLPRGRLVLRATSTSTPSSSR